MPRAGYEHQRVLSKTAAARREGILGGLIKTRCPGLPSLAHSPSSRLNLFAPTDRSEEWAASVLHSPQSAASSSSLSSAPNLLLASSAFPRAPPPPQPCFTPLTHMRDAIWGLFHSACWTSSSGGRAPPVPALTRHISARKGHASTLAAA